jgi:hypothetical protein
LVPNDQEAIQNLEKKKISQEHFFHYFSNRRDKQKLEQVKIYLKSNDKESLGCSELMGNFDSELKD